MTLHPGNDGEITRCTLDNASLGDGVEYEALSYSWSRTEEPDEALTGSFHANGRLVFALPNLILALKWLRYTDRPCRIWVDYICINQANTEERNAQVQLMGQIYERARRVVCFLGESDDTSSEVIDDLGMIANTKTHLAELFSNFNLDAVDRKGRDIQRFLQRPWFHRLWTVQEFALAKSTVLVCGPRTISWDTIKHAQINLTEHYECCGYYVQSVNGISYAMNMLKRVGVRSLLLSDRDKSPSLCGMLAALEAYKATDKRDHIYALLGMLPVQGRPTEPDYSLTPGDRVSTDGNSYHESRNQDTLPDYLTVIGIRPPGSLNPAGWWTFPTSRRPNISLPHPSSTQRAVKKRFRRCSAWQMMRRLLMTASWLT